MSEPEHQSERIETPAAAEAVQALIDNLARVLHAPAETLRLCVLCLVSEGHLILEDFPGVGKAPKDRIAATIVDTAEELLRERA